MNKLFDAIRNQHPGCEVVDVRFLVNLFDVADQDVDKLDDGLATAVTEAVELAAPA